MLTESQVLQEHVSTEKQLIENVANTYFFINIFAVYVYNPQHKSH